MLQMLNRNWMKELFILEWWILVKTTHPFLNRGRVCAHIVKKFMMRTEPVRVVHYFTACMMVHSADHGITDAFDLNPDSLSIPDSGSYF